MKVLLGLMALTHLCCGLQAPLHYKYKYFGSVLTGIPELENQASGWAMRADVHAYTLKDDGVVIFQLSNFEMAEHNDHLGCDVRGDIPSDHFHRPEDEDMSSAVEAPFIAHLFDHEDYAIGYIEDKYLWLTNMRKGIAAIFRNEILKANIEHQIDGTFAEELSNGHVTNIFSVKEETMFGKCKVDYTVYPVPEQLAGTRNRQLEDRMEEDVQRPKSSTSSGSYTKKGPSKTSKKSRGRKTSKTSSKTAGKYSKSNAPEIQHTLWHVVRSVNFDDCDDRVNFQVTPHGVSGSAGGSQYEWSRSRSSVSEFLFRGSGGHARLESAAVEGATTVTPMGFKTETVQARINQTLHLVSVTSGGQVPSIPLDMKYSPTWMYEVFSFADTPEESKPYPWVVYTGKGDKMRFFQAFGVDVFTPDEISKIKDTIIDYVNRASLSVTDLDQEGEQAGPGALADYLKKASVLFKHLSTEDVQEVFDHYFDKALHHHDEVGRKLVVDAAAASGTVLTTRAILNSIKGGHIPPIQIMTIFFTLANDARCPLGVPDLMEYVLSVDVATNPILAPTLLINFAELVGTICIKPNAREIHYPGPLFGDHGCDLNKIKNVFVPFLRDMILNDTPSWEKIVAIKALYSLGTPFALPILSQVIEGKVKCPTDVRLHAIKALEVYAYFGHEQSIRNQVMGLLTDVYSDVGEPAKVRSMALDVIVSWRPEPSFWHRLARTTWREPSKEFAAFATLIIQSYANFEDQYFKKQNQAASHALKFAKPFTPSLSFSLQMTQEHLIDKHIRKYRVLGHESSLQYMEFYYFLMTNLGGFNLVNGELSFRYIENGFDTNIMTKKISGGIAARVAQDFYDKIQDTINSATLTENPHDYSELFVRMFDHMKLYLPFSKEAKKHMPFFETNKLAELGISLGLGHDLVLSKFFNPIDMTTFHPTELGLPVIGKVSTPVLLTSVSHTTLSTGGGTPWPPTEALKKVELSSEVLVSISSEATSSLHVLLPWSRQWVSSGVRATRDVTVPLNIKGGFGQNNDGGQHLVVNVDVQSQFKKKFSLVKASNTPFTGILPILPLKGSPPPNMKAITHGTPKAYKMALPGTYTGLAVDVTWTSEMGLPIHNFNIRQQFMDCINLEGSPWSFYAWTSPTVKFWSLDVELDPEHSATKNISFEITKGVFGKSSEDLTQQSGGDDFSQYDQKSGGFSDYDQETYDVDSGFQVSQGFQENGKEVETTAHINYGDSFQQRSEKLQGYFGGPAFTTSLKIDLDGTEHRSYEVMYSYSKTKASAERNVKKSQISLIRSAIPGKDDESASMCLDVQKSSPSFSKLDTVEGLLAANLDKEFKAGLTLGCTGKPVLSVKGTYHMSDAWKEKLSHDLHESCDHDPFNPLYNFHSHAMYDDVTVTAEWEKVCDLKKYPLTTKIFTAAEKILDLKFINYQQCDHSDAPHKLYLDAHRSPQTGDWAFNGRRGQSALHLEAIPHNSVFNYMFSVVLKKPFNSHPEHDSSSDSDSNTCVLGDDLVRTFDGFVYNYVPSECWKVAATDCSIENGWMVLARSSKGESPVPEAKYIDVQRGLVIEFYNHVLKVNGKSVDPIGEQQAIKSDDGQTVATVHKKNDFFMVHISNSVYITIKDKLQIHIPFYKSDSLCGLCGNRDNEPESELVGPHRCFYSDPNMFAASWTAGGDTCDLYTLLELREKAEHFQSNCSTIESLHEKCAHFNPRVFKYGWMVKKEETDRSCVSSSPIPYCDETGPSYAPSYKTVKFNCWPNEKAPSAIKEALEHGDIYTKDPVTVEPYSYAYHSLSMPTACSTIG